jgi:branched-chain amino acid transport system permease protein
MMDKILQQRTILQLVGLLLLLGIAVAYPQIDSNGEDTTIAFFTLLFAGMVTSWNMLAGYTGYIALGHAAYFGVGAYAFALICKDFNLIAGYNLFLLLPVCGLLAGLTALPTGWVALRVRRHTFIVITIAIFFIAQLMCYNLSRWTNGSTGLDVPFPLDWSGQFFNIPFYYTALLLLVLAIAISWWIRQSKYGLGLLAIRDDEDRALSLGVKTGLLKLSAFVLSAVMVGMAGALWAYFTGAVYPATTFDPTYDISMALMGFLGGMGTIIGPIIGALLLEPLRLKLSADAPNFYLISYGALFLVVILLLPRGIWPTLREYWDKWLPPRRIRSNGAVITNLSDQEKSAILRDQEGVNL